MDTTTWRTGFHAREITPPVGTRQSGFVIRQQPSDGVHDPLYARALALADGRRTRCCILVLDLIGVDLELARAIRRKASEGTDLPEGGIAVLATHTHGGPVILPRAHLGPVDEPYRAHVVREAATAVVEAIAALRETEIRMAIGSETTIAKNRRDPAGPIDADVPVLRFDRDGSPVGLLTGYACHPVTLGPDNLRITRDYPGEVVDALERLHPGAFVAFATGCCGQINTGHRAEDSLRPGGASKRTFAEARRIGRTLAEVASDAAERASSAPPLTGPLRVARSTLELPLAPLPDDTATMLAEWRRELQSVRGRDPAREAVLRALTAWGDTLERSGARSVEVEAMCIGLGNACLAIYPGETFVEFGLELKAALPGRDVVTLAYGNAAPGYLPHRSAYPAGGYEVAEAYRYYGRPGPFPPEAGERLQQEMLRLAQEVLA